ncbi:DUF4133 domain-containing protein [Cruoricaptor ignavus]|uniref:DUF4133 domain-containing protein n=1 Tax=Cruoricaptor ignavus TaxID=1118202 RepID=A0A7M1T6X0_9FLAO|nr:DUF4133 domain-containing protein [Cruoricaptor ignavus]QOR74622.1 DUF4133 domain-containing protein [Cruoricaptor ignavus]
MAFYLYKGLKKPLYFLGLKEKYIYYALGVVFGGFLLLAVLSATVGTLGTVAGLAIIGVGILIIFKIQDKKGLYSKTKNDGEVHEIPNMMGKRLKKK